MKRQNIKYSMLIIILFLLCGAFTLTFLKDVAYALEKSLVSKTIVVENGRISVDLKGITVEQFIKKLNKEVDLKFHVNKSLSQEKLYVQFEQISLHEGLMKIFYGMNYFFCFLENGKLSEVILLSKKNAYDGKSAPDVSRRKSRGIPKTLKSRIDRTRQRRYVRSQRNKRRPDQKPNLRN